MTTRTTSGVLAVVAGLLVAPGAAQAADLPLLGGIRTTTTDTTTQPTTTATDTTPAAPTTTALTPTPTVTQPTPSTTQAAPSTTTAPTETGTTTTTSTVPTLKPVPRSGTSDDAGEKPLTDDSGGEGRSSARAEKRRTERAKAKAAKAAAKQEAKKAKSAKAKADAAKAKADEQAAADKAKADADAAAAGTDPTATGTTTADPATGGDLGTDLLEPGLAAQVPNFFISQFKIPPFLLPIYQAAGIQYGIRWEILAAINEIETDYGRNLSVSTAGAQGWMQFMPATWQQYGVDANGDDKADPNNPVDAIFAAARYLKAAGADTDVRQAIFAYNHADWYVDSVLARARLISVLPTDLIGSLTGLTQGIFPVTGEASYVGADEAGTTAGETTKSTDGGAKRSVQVTAAAGADAIAVQDGTITAIGESARLGKFVQLRDVYGNRYTYGHLDSIAETYAAPKSDDAATDKTLAEPGSDDAPKDPAPTTAATAGKQRAADDAAAKDASGDAKPASSKAAGGHAKASTTRTKASADAAKQATTGPQATDTPDASDGKERAFANPDYAAAAQPPDAPALGDLSATDPSSVAPTPDPAAVAPDATPTDVPSTEASTANTVQRPLRRGSRVVSGTKLGTIAKVDERNAKKAADGATVKTGVDPQADAAKTPDPKDQTGQMTFEVRPAGQGAPRIDPRPILDGWKLLQTTAVYGANDKNPLYSGGVNATAGQVLLLSKAQLQQRVLADGSIDIYPAGREQIKSGLIDRRILATLEYLTANGHKLSVTSLARPGSITTSGNLSEHDSGNAVDIGSVDGQRIQPSTQGKGSITDTTIRLLLQLQGTMKPHQIISLMPPSDFGGADNILALPDHADHIHVGFHVEAPSDPKLGKQLTSALKPGQWDDLIARLGQIANPKVSAKPSKFALKAKNLQLTPAEKSAKKTK